MIFLPSLSQLGASSSRDRVHAILNYFNEMGFAQASYDVASRKTRKKSKDLCPHHRTLLMLFVSFSFVLKFLRLFCPFLFLFCPRNRSYFFRSRTHSLVDNKGSGPEGKWIVVHLANFFFLHAAILSPPSSSLMCFLHILLLFHFISFPLIHILSSKVPPDRFFFLLFFPPARIDLPRHFFLFSNFFIVFAAGLLLASPSVFFDTRTISMFFELLRDVLVLSALSTYRFYSICYSSSQQFVVSISLKSVCTVFAKSVLRKCLQSEKM